MRARRVAVGAILVLATLVGTLLVFAIWAKRQVANTDNWVDTSTEVFANQKVREGLGTYLVQQLYASAPIEQGLRDALPPRLQPLAGPASSGLRRVAEDQAPKVLGTAAALNAWEKANREGHKLLLKVLRSERVKDGKVTLDLRGLATQIADQTGLPPAAVDKIPPDVANLTVLKSSQLKAAQTGFDILENLPIVLGILLALLFGGAIWLSPDRRRTILSCGLVLIISGLLVLALRRVGGHAVVAALADAPNAHAAAPDVWNIITSLLKAAAWGGILLGLFVVIGAWLSGPGRRAVAIRRWAAPASRDNPVVVHAVLFVLLVLLVWWGPVPWTNNFWPIVIFAVIAFGWLEWWRRRTAAEFPEAQAGERSNPVSNAWRMRKLDRLGRMRQNGALSEEEFEREKAALT
jgi:hypothetical protein